MFHPKKIVTVLGITTLMLSPLAPVSTFTGADGAYAGNGNGNGGGGGNGNGGGGGGGGGGGKSSDSSSSGSKGGEKSSAARSNGNGGSNGSQQAASAKPAKPKAAAADETDFAANELGNMNGAMNANINAVLAHIRNGNTNGPVGTLAALVAADAQLGDLDAEEVLERAEIWDRYEADLTAALGEDYASVQDYLDAKQMQADYADLLAEWTELDEAYQQALVDDPDNAEALNPGPAPEDPGFVEIAELEDLLAAPPEGEAPTEDEVAAAEAVTNAEAAVLALWNKNPDSTDGMTEEEEALLQSLRDRFSAAELEQIAAASGS